MLQYFDQPSRFARAKVFEAEKHNFKQVLDVID